MTIILGDCLDEMRKMADNSIDAIVTDPPFGISFMGKHWDHGIPSKEYWQEMLRILKPGGHLLAAGLPKMIHRLISIIEDSGFEIRELLMHLFGSGFPKSHNHFGLEGYGTALKPAWEGWSLAMKPCEGTFKKNAEKWGLAGINIDACRIGLTVETWPKTRAYCRSQPGAPSKGTQETGEAPKGRWPANLILDEEAAEQVDFMSGMSKSPAIGSMGGGSKSHRVYLPGFTGKKNENGYGDSGGASRFFYCPKASSSERNAGLDGKPNTHPCVKPLKLMQYLINLIMPPNPNAILLDPFAGSGSTILAAKGLGINAIGIEKEPEYAEIAKKRVEAFAFT